MFLVPNTFFSKTKRLQKYKTLILNTKNVLFSNMIKCTIFKYEECSILYI